MLFCKYFSVSSIILSTTPAAIRQRRVFPKAYLSISRSRDLPLAPKAKWRISDRFFTPALTNRRLKHASARVIPQGRRDSGPAGSAPSLPRRPGIDNGPRREMDRNGRCRAQCLRRPKTLHSGSKWRTKERVTSGRRGIGRPGARNGCPECNISARTPLTKP